MSAIGGIVSNKHIIDTDKLKDMSNAIINRGGDVENQWVTKGVGLFNKLLWTTPESKIEILPLHIPAHQCTLTADARIDNRYELIKILGLQQRDPAKLTDSELILQSYLKWNEACVEYLIGDFSFAIWDEREQKLFCARDHLGIKPFYYYSDKNSFIFASQIDAVHIGANLKKEIDANILKQFYEFKMLSCKNSMFKNIKRLGAGHTLVFQNGTLHTHRYWFPEKIKLNKSLTLNEAVTGFTTLLNRAISDRMRSAYPIGCEVSGGLDSSSVLTLAAKIETKQNLYAFANVYGDLACDESSYIQDVVNKLGIDPILTQANEMDFNHYNLNMAYSIGKDWPAKGAFLDAFGEFEEAQKRGVRVVLTGHGGDAVAEGQYDMLSDYFVGRHFDRLYQFYKRHGLNWRFVKRFMIIPFLSPKIKGFIYFLRGRSPTEEESVYINCLSEEKMHYHSFVQKKELEILLCPSTQFWFESNPYVQFGEYHKIEYRHPFFDKRLVEFMLALPPWYKYDGKTTKIIIRESMKEILPHSVLSRKDKAEFSSIIMSQILTNFPKKIRNKQFYDIISKDYVIQLTDKLRSESLSQKELNKLWSIINLESWLNANFTEKGKE